MRSRICSGVVAWPSAVSSTARRSTIAACLPSDRLLKLLRSMATTVVTLLSTSTLPVRSRMRPRGASTSTVRMRLASACTWKSDELTICRS